MKGRLIGFGEPKNAKKQPKKIAVKHPKVRHKCNGFLVIKTTNGNHIIKGASCNCLGVVRADGSCLSKREIVCVSAALYPFGLQHMKQTPLEGDNIIDALKTISKDTKPC